MVVHNGPFGALFLVLCSLCRVLVDSLIVRGIGVVLYYYTMTLYYTITFYSLYYTIRKKTSKINDLGLLLVNLYYAV